MVLLGPLLHITENQIDFWLNAIEKSLPVFVDSGITRRNESREADVRRNLLSGGLALNAGAQHLHRGVRSASQEQSFAALRPKDRPRPVPANTLGLA